MKDGLLPVCNPDHSCLYTLYLHKREPGPCVKIGVHVQCEAITATSGPSDSDPDRDLTDEALERSFYPRLFFPRQSSAEGHATRRSKTRSAQLFITASPAGRQGFRRPLDVFSYSPNGCAPNPGLADQTASLDGLEASPARPEAARPRH
ncbi:hypothetical protein CDD80_1634 [Ophiocordyceps camponoti-rufipedis]|uniref:Uncharacterized protein n=1 Tax=Ophiocordyceps camponoti-rufipedis TaxID=2004952 RepID=A0A2C5ZKV2_9HYPO|nr:hypothetical protein CDD80_1634 [Ophiocordyceps camponoti-rufipedis]